MTMFRFPFLPSIVGNHNGSSSGTSTLTPIHTDRPGKSYLCPALCAFSVCANCLIGFHSIYCHRFLRCPICHESTCLRVVSFGMSPISLFMACVSVRHFLHFVSGDTATLTSEERREQVARISFLLCLGRVETFPDVFFFVFLGFFRRFIRTCSSLTCFSRFRIISYLGGAFSLRRFFLPKVKKILNSEQRLSSTSTRHCLRRHRCVLRVRLFFYFFRHWGYQHP